MKRLLPAAVLLATVLGVPRPPQAAAGPATVVVLGPVATVRPLDHPTGPQAAAIFAARNEFESFQVVVEAGSTPVGHLRVSLDAPLAGPGGTIPATDVTIYREAYYRVVHPSDLEGAPGRWPDPLIPAVDPFYRERRTAFPVTVPAGENRVAWVDVLVPKTQAAGRYDGPLRLTGDGFSAEIPVHLTVLRFTLPSTASLASTFGMEWDGECKAFTGDNCFADETKQWELKSLFVRAALEDRVTISYPAFQPPSGNGAPGSESAYFRRYILPLLQGRSPQDPGGNWTPVRLPGAKLTEIQVDSDPSQLAQWKLEAAHGGFAARAFLYACDEPNTDAGAWKACKTAARQATSHWPGLRVLVTGTIRNASTFGAASLIDLLVPIVNEMDDKPGGTYAGNQRPKYDSFLSGDPRNRVFMYTSCESHGCSGDSGSDPYWAGWPSYVLDQPGSEQRAMGWLSFEYRTTGDLYYDTDLHLDTAWTNQYDFTGNGDGTLFYPGRACSHGTGCIGGTHDIPIDSLRLKRIRDGREDYEYLSFLARHGKGPQAMQIARGLFPRMFDTHVPEARLDAARKQLADLIAGIVGGPAP